MEVYKEEFTLRQMTCRTIFMRCVLIPVIFCPMCKVMLWQCPVHVEWWDGCKNTCYAPTIWRVEASCSESAVNKDGAAILFIANIWPNHSANSSRENAWDHLQIIRHMFREYQTGSIAKQISITARDRLIK